MSLVSRQNTPKGTAVSTARGISHFSYFLYAKFINADLAYKLCRTNKLHIQILWTNFTHKNHLFVVFKFCLACAKCFEIKLVFVRSADTLQNLGDLVKRDFIVARA